MFFIFGLLWGFRELEVSTPKGAKKRSHPQVENDNACFPVGGPDSLQCPCQLIRDKPVVFFVQLTGEQGSREAQHDLRITSDNRSCFEWWLMDAELLVVLDCSEIALKKRTIPLRIKKHAQEKAPKKA
jgi:hypothetical protein